MAAQILWHAPKEPSCENPGFELLWMPQWKTQAADLLVIDTSCGPKDAWLQRRSSFTGPALIVCGPGELQQLLPQLPDHDAIALRTEPWPLLAHRIQRLLRYHPHKDLLTGLLTRSAWHAGIEARGTQRPAVPLCMVVFDIDRFKAVNDSFGHLAGDRVLAALGERATSLLAGRFELGRVGGEKIAAWTDAPPADARRDAEGLLAAIRSGGCGGYRLTLSAGLAQGGAEGSEILLRQADEALYAAKARGRDRLVSYGELEQEARMHDRDVDMQGFENRTRVMAERVADVINRRGRKLFEELKQRAERDALTGLYSRGYLDQRLPQAIELAEEEDRPLVVALLDLDHFGQVNKQHGWPTGDRVLADVAERIRDNMRTLDWVARYGGEEICIVMLGIGTKQAAKVLERIRQAVASAPFEATDGSAVQVTLSGGAVSCRAGEPIEQLLDRCSDQLLAAKRAGRNRLRLEAAPGERG